MITIKDDEVAVLFPWRPSTPERDTLYRWVSQRWRMIFPRILPFVGVGPYVGTFNRSAARNQAANLADRASTFILADADTIPQTDVLIDAIIDSIAEERCVLPYTTYYNLTAADTKAILKRPPDTALLEPTRWIYKLEDSISGCVVVPKRVFHMAGGFDERFQGWGWEDRAFIQAIECMHKPVHRLPGYVQHLYHDAPEAVREGNPYYAANRALYERYRDAETKDEMMKVIWGET